MMEKSRQLSYCFKVLLLLCLSSRATAVVPVDNSTIILPPGTSNHGDPKLICTPTRWTDIVVFFPGNYFAHAATVTARPGATYMDSIFDAIMALLVPVAGVNRGLDALCSRAKFAKTDLRAAARAGALCEVVRLANKEIEPEILRPATIYLTPKCKQNWLSASIHGRVRLPPGFGMAILPSDFKFEGNHDSRQGQPPIILSSGYSAMKILVSIGQLLFASSTLYRARGDQINRYGYAAFGLTVAPYAPMSLLNFLGSLMCPEYPNFYLVETQTSEHARSSFDAIIEGTVGRADRDSDSLYIWARAECSSNLRRRGWWTCKEPWMRLSLALTPTMISWLMIGLLSGFQAGSSTKAQRIAIITWYVAGSFLGAADGELRDGTNVSDPIPSYTMRAKMSQMSLGGAAAIAGFVVVGMMLKDYGVCTITS